LLNPPTEASHAEEVGWWKKWLLHKQKAGEKPHILLETYVSGTRLAAELSLNPDGRFEAQFSASLPPAHRGWRVAANKVVVGEHIIEARNVALLPPAEATGCIVVLLPQDFTLPPSGSSGITPPRWATRLPNIINGLQDGQPTPIYYLACVSPDDTQSQAEFALAVTALGWPSGFFVSLPVSKEGPRATLEEGLGRLRWLFGGTLEVFVVNLDSGCLPMAFAAGELAPEWAPVRQVISMDGESENEKVTGRGNYRHGHIAPRRSRAALLPRYPIVFCHGMLAFSMLKMRLPDDLNCFSSLRSSLRERGLRVLYPEVPPTSGVKDRAALLKEQIIRWTDEPVNLISHSMGGLDARYLITHLDMADRVKSLTTVSAPHRGTYLADWFIANFRNRVPLLPTLEAFGVNVNGFKDCRLGACEQFNLNTPDSPNVTYFSYGGEVSPSHLTPALRRAWNILTPVEGPNDGMVSVKSARWGEYLGTLHADHYAQTPDAVWLRDREDFDSVSFYARMIEDLARRGF
jgi:triacylglycerol lipase